MEYAFLGKFRSNVKVKKLWPLKLSHIFDDLLKQTPGIRFACNAAEPEVVSVGAFSNEIELDDII